MKAYLLRIKDEKEWRMFKANLAMADISITDALHEHIKLYNKSTKEFNRIMKATQRRVEKELGIN